MAPKKKKEVAPEAPPQEETAVVPAPAEELCNHANLQRPDGKPIYCTRHKGHDGDHACSLDGTIHLAIWSDAAGIPL